MAEGRRHGEESVKLFVGQVPKQITETQLLELFQQFALVDQVNIIKDKITRASRGSNFICLFRIIKFNLVDLEPNVPN